MLTGISLENIKAIKEKGSIDLSSFTLLIGENGSGKSTFLQVLSLLSENSSSVSLEDGKYTILGGIREIENDPEFTIDVIIRGTVDWSFTDLDYLNEVSYEIMIGFGYDGIIEMGLKLDIKNPSQEMKSALNMTSNTILNSRFFTYEDSEEQEFQLYNNKTKTILGPIIIKLNEPFKFTITSPVFTISDVDRPLVSIVNSIFGKIKQDLTEIVHIPALRGIDARDYRMLDNPTEMPIDPSDFNKQSQKLVSSMEFDRDVEPKISLFLESIIHRKCRTKLSSGMKISLEIFNGQKWINIMNEGLGSNPLIHLIYQVVTAPRGSIIMIEEPEIHLFPSAQKRLISELIQFAKNNNMRLLFTTHSEHVYYVLSKYKEQNDDDVKIYFFDRDDRSNNSIVSEVTNENKIGILKEFLSIDTDDIAELLDVSGKSQ